MKYICVFCSASSNVNEAWLNIGFRLGQELAISKRHVVFGGTPYGLMNALHTGVIAGNGQITGILSQTLIDSGDMLASPLTHSIITPDLNSRKKKMYDYSDGFIALPGGLGTLDEIFDVIAINVTTNQTKPIWIVNLDNFFDSLFDQLEHISSLKLSPQSCENWISEVTNITTLLDLINQKGR